MRMNAAVSPPPDAALRRKARAVPVYGADALPRFDEAFYASARARMTKVDEIVVPPREARTFAAPASHFFRVVCSEGPQVGDLNLWNADNLEERFFSGKTRALNATHLTTGHALWSTLPHLRKMATITHDSLGWYGFDQDGASVHDVIGTRCDPYTNALLTGTLYENCCHSNLTRAIGDRLGLPFKEAEPLVHDVFNIFMCTGFTRDEGRYFMKASPVRPGDYLELYAEMNLVGALSACPGGDCGAGHSSDAAPCHPLRIDVFSAN